MLLALVLVLLPLSVLSDCSEETEFSCRSDGACVPNEYVCDGDGDCDDGSDELASVCDKCKAENLFRCPSLSGQEDYCVKKEYTCDGENDCDDGSDELASLCDNCTADNLVPCTQNGRKLCMGASLACDGEIQCDDSYDELASRCDNCTAEHLFRCPYKSRDICVKVEWKGDGQKDCDDFSDELSDTCDDPAHFQCTIQGRNVCLEKAAHQCDGVPDCDKDVDELASLCQNCSAETLFQCPKGGQDICLNSRVKCDGTLNCDDKSDELLSECGCSNTGRFQCTSYGHDVCLSSEEYSCDGEVYCDDLYDESPGLCSNCTTSGLVQCRDGSKCIKEDHVCNGGSNCADGSDESDTWSQCTYCKDPGNVACPGFPGNCARLCDGRPTCPDGWDELLSTCKAHNTTCAGHACSDGSACLQMSGLCDGAMGCANGEDESAAQCSSHCDRLHSGGYPVFTCATEGSGCIWSVMACRARTQPLCSDGSDMAECNNKCFIDFPGQEDPYRRPCADGSRCVRRITWCDGDVDCLDGSDEDSCPIVNKFSIGWIGVVCLGGFVLSHLVYMLAKYLSNNKPLIIMDKSAISLSFSVNRFTIPSIEFVANTTGFFTAKEPHVPALPIHLALTSMESLVWSWQGVWAYTPIKTVIQTRDAVALLDLLTYIEIQDAHPSTVYRIFQGMFLYLESQGVQRDQVTLALRESLGHHRLAHLVLKGPPNWLDIKTFHANTFVTALMTIHKLLKWLVLICTDIQPNMSSYFVLLDYIKDIVMVSLLWEAKRNLEMACQTKGCLVASDAELAFLTTLQVSLAVSIVTTSLFCFSQRKHFFAKSPKDKAFGLWSDLLLLVFSPLLPIIFHLEIESENKQLKKKGKTLTLNQYHMAKKKIAFMDEIALQARTIEIIMEAIPQIIMILALGSFYYYSMTAPSGLRYSYFWGMAKIVLKGNKVVFFASLLLSLIGPCFFHVALADHGKHKSMCTMPRKMVLLARNLFLLVSRVSIVTTSLVISVLARSDFAAETIGADMSLSLDILWINHEFIKHFGDSLKLRSLEIAANTEFLLGLILLHLLLVSVHAWFYSPKFPHSSMKGRVLHLLSSIWLPMPYLTQRGLDTGEERPQIWFLISLHTLENIVVIVASRVMYLSQLPNPSYPRAILILDVILVGLNLLGILTTVVYHKYMELYQDIAHIPCPGRGKGASLGAQMTSKVVSRSRTASTRQLTESGTSSLSSLHNVSNVQIETLNETCQMPHESPASVNTEMLLRE